jgi:predicted nucleic acid-binding protein
MRVLLDNDVVLDLILDREPFAEAAAAVFQLHEQKRIEGYVSGITLINAFYVTRKLKGIDVVRRAVGELLTTLKVCPLNRAILANAHNSTFTDFEDAVQHASAAAIRLEAIVTRNVGDYRDAALPVFTPADLLERLKQQQS